MLRPYFSNAILEQEDFSTGLNDILSTLSVPLSIEDLDGIAREAEAFTVPETKVDFWGIEVKFSNSDLIGVAREVENGRDGESGYCSISIEDGERNVRIASYHGMRIDVSDEKPSNRQTIEASVRGGVYSITSVTKTERPLQKQLKPR